MDDLDRLREAYEKERESERRFHRDHDSTTPRLRGLKVLAFVASYIFLGPHFHVVKIIVWSFAIAWILLWGLCRLAFHVVKKRTEALVTDLSLAAVHQQNYVHPERVRAFFVSKEVELKQSSELCRQQYLAAQHWWFPGEIEAYWYELADGYQRTTEAIRAIIDQWDELEPIMEQGRKDDELWKWKIRHERKHRRNRKRHSDKTDN